MALTCCDTLVHGRNGFIVAAEIGMQYSQMQESILVVRLDVLVRTVSFYRVVKVAVQMINGGGVRTGAPGIKEATTIVNGQCVAARLTNLPEEMDIRRSCTAPFNHTSQHRFHVVWHSAPIVLQLSHLELHDPFNVVKARGRMRGVVSLSL